MTTPVPPRTFPLYGRCCRRKPLRLDRPNDSPPGRCLYCDHCGRLYGPDCRQVANWAWCEVEGGFVRTGGEE